MSLATWLDEFYLDPADEAAEGGEGEALLHSYKKWTGLRKENLKKHGVRKENGFILDSEGSEYCIGSFNCALCVLTQDRCNICPLTRYRNGYSCSSCTPDELSGVVNSPWPAWRLGGDPRPMLSLIKATFVAFKAGTLQDAVEEVEGEGEK